MTETLSVLIRNLNSPDSSERRRAALGLGASRDGAVAAHLLRSLGEETNGRVLEDLTWALVQHAAEVDLELVEMLGSRDPAQRRIAAHVISKVADPAHFERVVALVADDDPDVAIKAYRAAANTGGARAVPALVARLGIGDLLRRDSLSTALAFVGEPAVPALIEALGSADGEVRAHAADALGQIGGPAADAAAEALEKAAADDQVWLAAVSALGQLGESAVEPLARLAAGEDVRVAQLASRLLADRGSTSA